jgi:Peptidase family S41
VFKVGLQGRLLLTIACLLSLGLATADAARADEADDLGDAIAAHIRERLPASALAVTPADGGRVVSFVRYIQKTFYYPTNARDLQASALAAIDSVDSPTDASSLVQAAIVGMVGSLGHGARLLTTLGGSDAEGDSAGPGPSARQVGSIRILTLPNMNVSDTNVAHTCADFARYAETVPADGTTALVLDLRGNASASLTDSSCLASLFLKKNQPLFWVTDKQGNVVKYQSQPAGRGPIGLPLTVLIDNRTDSGGLLVAAILQYHRRATVIGEQKPDINDAVCSLVFPRGANRGVILPTGEIMLPDKRPLSAGFGLDATVPAHDEEALMNAARAFLARQQ